MGGRATDIQAAAELARQGGVLVYPTETLYALGCDARNLQACRHVAAIKGRPESKPLPLIVSDLNALRGIALLQTVGLADGLPEDLARLAELHWPGPLSVLVRTCPDLPALVRDCSGFSSVRVSPHPLARELCRLAGGVLVATSANKSGQRAAARPEELDTDILAACDGAVLDEPWPAGGAPSTLVRLLGHGQVEVLRLGAVSLETLARHFSVLESGQV